MFSNALDCIDVLNLSCSLSVLRCIIEIIKRIWSIRKKRVNAKTFGTLYQHSHWLVWEWRFPDNICMRWWNDVYQHLAVLGCSFASQIRLLACIVLLDKGLFLMHLTSVAGNPEDWSHWVTCGGGYCLVEIYIPACISSGERICLRSTLCTADERWSVCRYAPSLSCCCQLKYIRLTSK